MKYYTFFLCLPSGSEALLYHLSELKGMALWKQKYESLGLDASGIDGTVVCVLPTCFDFTFESLIIMVSFFYRGYYCCWFFHPEGEWAASVSIESGEFKKHSYSVLYGRRWMCLGIEEDGGTRLLCWWWAFVLSRCMSDSYHKNSLEMLHWAFWKKLVVLAGLSVVKMALKPEAACDIQIL